MAKSRGSSTWIWIVAGLVVLVGLCCVGTAGVGFFAYQKEREAEQLALEEVLQLEQMEREAREQALRDDMQGSWATPSEEAQMLAAPPSLTLRPSPSSDRASRRIRATVTRSLGSSGVAIGDTCEFAVEVLDTAQEPAGYWCRAFVQCGTMRLYGTDTPQPNGYFPCEIYDSPLGVAGEDLDTSANGGDGAFQIDTRAGRLVVFDDSLSMVGGAFRVEAAVASVR
jgi:hypothetical protein